MTSSPLRWSSGASMAAPGTLHAERVAWFGGVNTTRAQGRTPFLRLIWVRRKKNAHGRETRRRIPASVFATADGPRPLPRLSARRVDRVARPRNGRTAGGPRGGTPDLANALAGRLHLGLPAARAPGGGRPRDGTAHGVPPGGPLPEPAPPSRDGSPREAAGRSSGRALPRSGPLDRAPRSPRAAPADPGLAPTPRATDALSPARRGARPAPRHVRQGQRGG